MAVTDLSPGRHDLILVRGDSVDDLSLTFTDDDGETPVDLTGWTWLAEIRTDFDAATVALQFDVDTTDAADGILYLNLDADQWPSEAAVLPTVKWRWDLQGTNGSTVRTYLSGKVKSFGDVSR